MKLIFISIYILFSVQSKVIIIDLPRPPKINPNIKLNLSSTDDRKIYHGPLAKIDDYPFMVFIYIYYPQERSYCGGTYIHAKYVLSTNFGAPSEAQKIKLCMGYSTMPDTGLCPIFRLSWRVVIDADTDNRIFVLILDRPFIHTQAIFPIPIQPFDIVDYYGVECQVPGWGQDTYSHKHKFQLRVGELIINENLTTESEIWTDSLGHNLCPGDEGGPLICSGVLVGIAHGAEFPFCWSGMGRAKFENLMAFHKFLERVTGGGYDSSKWATPEIWLEVIAVGIGYVVVHFIL